VFVSQVLGDTELTWHELFRTAGAQYEEPRLVLFTGYVQSACGTGQSAMGPFYCSLDDRIYIDLSFYEDLRSRFGADGDFAQAYVIAHEVGHHVQNLTGTLQRTASLRQRLNEREANRVSVMQELQADCYAGVWGHYAARRGLLGTAPFQPLPGNVQSDASCTFFPETRHRVCHGFRHIDSRK
jgi:uncharacterized protein